MLQRPTREVRRVEWRRALERGEACFSDLFRRRRGCVFFGNSEAVTVSKRVRLLPLGRRQPPHARPGERETRNGYLARLRHTALGLALSVVSAAVVERQHRRRVQLGFCDSVSAWRTKERVCSTSVQLNRQSHGFARFTVSAL